MRGNEDNMNLIEDKITFCDITILRTDIGAHRNSCAA